MMNHIQPSRVQKKKNRAKNNRIDPHALARLQASKNSVPGTTIDDTNTSTSRSIDNNNEDNKVVRRREPSSLKEVGIHPLLMGKSNTQDDYDMQDDDHNNNKKKVNPAKILRGSNKRGFNLNPYIDQTSTGTTATAEHHRRDLKFNPAGKYIAKAEDLREQLQAAQLAKIEQDRLASLGLLPDNLKGEDRFAKQVPPPWIEWWDQPYLKDRSYKNIDEKDRLVYMDELDENNPITHYIQFPQLPSITTTTKAGTEIKVYLTKKEQKKKRRIERLVKHKQEQAKIRAGLVPPPPPKVKLKNMMQVMTNEAIKDPTALETKIKKEIEQRELEHIRQNEERKLDPEMRSTKKTIKQEERLQTEGIHCYVFKLTKQISNMYKVNVNAMQLGLKGCTLELSDKISMIIAEGDYKNMKKYEKLLLNRIDWTHDKNGNIINGNNRCELIAKFTELDFKFDKWSNKRFTDSEMDAFINYCQLKKIENYYKLCT